MISHEETSMTIPGDITLPTVPVLSSTMAYREIGGPEGAPVALFLHGNPTSSYIWRNIMPLVAPVARCVAPDLIGFGQSGKPDIDYSFFDQARHLDAFLEAAGITSAYLVLQDWGTGLGFHLAARRPDFVKGIAFMEFLRPFKDWEDLSGTPEVRAAFQGFRTPGVGEEMILDQNMFVEGLLPHGAASPITPEAIAVYRAPFATRESRRPTLAFPRAIPIGGEPADVHAAITEAHAAMRAADYPKLLFTAMPGAVTTPAFAAEFVKGQKNLEVVELPSGVHFHQEDHPQTIGSSVADWIRRAERSISGML
jgi:haloalkane dehalogenase